MTPGTVLEYNAERGTPTPLQFPEISDEVRLECESIAREMEYVAGVKYLADGTTYKGEAYLTQSMGAFYQADIFRLKLGYEPISETAAHITGIEMPVEAIEQLLDQIIQNIG